ncbi:probable F-box protein At2g36090 [Cicer arietinum]|uniref:Probable F-box protein At2g36090 n=1 Tax=Cicer arietinum TaxID=3827 RepID=A0A1S2Z216_CICAR|nr:probable F-box protein At2g36090 [Cicer arietinum]
MSNISGNPITAETTTISAFHSDIIQTNILTRLDGSALASVASTCSRFHYLCSTEHLWENACYSTWPSTNTPCVRHAISTFPNGSRSFFADCFSSHYLATTTIETASMNLDRTPRLISAVDIFHRKRLVFSKVVETETVTGWFRCSPFRVDMLEIKDVIKCPVQDTCRNLGEELRLSWILIDPVSRRAVNVSSGKAVTVQRHWLSGEVNLQFATVVYGEIATALEVALCSVVVTLVEESMEVREVSLQVEDMDGKHVNGRDSLVILKRALEGGRNWKGDGEEGHREFVKKKKEREERKKRAERRLDMLCLCVGLVSLTFVAFFAL